MNEFFKSTKFKILALLLALVFAFALRSAQTQTAVPMLSQLAGAILTPIQRTTAGVSYSVEKFLTENFSGAKIADQNEKLLSENADLRSKLVEYERIKMENEQLKNYLEIKEKNPDFGFEPAMVIARDNSDRFYSFTIDKGRSDGITVDDPVITESGLVGIVSEVGITHSKVLTILDATVNIGVIDAQSREVGVSGGDLTLAGEGMLRVDYLPRDGHAKPGDIIATTGVGGLYPRDIVVGIIKELVPDSKGLSLYAVTEPPVDIRDVENVLVITSFAGQASEQQGE